VRRRQRGSERLHLSYNIAIKKEAGRQKFKGI
jgi:hypothetical protein